jgi:hypothetical protein
MRTMGVLFVTGVMLAFTCRAADEAPWPAPVTGYVPVQPGEHPRLLFRKGDLPAIRERARTPE